MPRTWTNDSGLALSAANLNSLETDLTTALGVPDAALAGRLAGGATNAALLSIISALFPTVTAPEPSGSDDGPAINALMTANPGKAIAFRTGRSYKIETTLAVPSDTSLYGNRATLNSTTMANATALDQRFAITSTGVKGSGLPISVNLTKWNKTVTGISSTASLAAGDLVLISNDEVPVPGLSLANRYKGELNTIESVTNGTSLVLTRGAMQAYTAGASNLKIQKLTPVKNVTIRDLNIVMRGVGSAHNAIQFTHGRNCVVESCTITGAEDVGVGFKTVLGWAMRNCDVRKSTSNTSLALGPTGYGVCAWDASRHGTIENNYFEENRHHVAGGGVWGPAYIDVQFNTGRNSSSASYDAHENCFYWTFRENTAEVASHGFYIRGQYIDVIGNEVVDIAQEAYAVHAWDSVTEQRGIRLIQNKALRSTYGVSIGKASGETIEILYYDLEVTGNTMEDSGTNPFRIRYFDGLKYSGNTVNGGTGAGALIEGVDASTRSKNLSMNENDIKGTTSHGIHLKYVDDVRGSDGILLNCGGNGMLIEDCNRLNLSPKVRASAFAGIRIIGGTEYTLNNPDVSGSTNGVYDAVRAENVNTLNITGGSLSSARYAVHVTTTTTSKVNVVGTKVSHTTHATKVNVDAGTTYTNAGLL